MIYLDHTSHTQADPAVLAEFCRVEKEFSANPMSAHRAGEEARAEFDRVTAAMAYLLDAKPEEIIFTSGATEANNMAIKGLTRAYRHVGKHIITTCLEHPSVSSPLAALRDQGWEVELADIQPDGTVDLEHIAALLRRDTVLVSIPWVDSELGAIQPVKAICELLEKHPHCRLHIDGAQAVGKIDLSFSGSFERIDTLSFSSHKFHGICGSGALLKRQDVLLDALISGGVSTTVFRGGTPALALAASSYKALELAVSNQNERLKKVRTLRCSIVDALEQYPRVRINSPKEGSPYILNVSVQGIKGIEFQEMLDERGICVSVKSACSVPGTPSRPVFAVSRDKKNAVCSWRIGLSHCTKFEEVERFLKAFDECYNEG